MSDIVTTQVFSNGEQGITATKMNNIIGLSSVQTDFVASKPLASSVASNDQLLLLTAGGVYARTNFSTVTTSVSGSLTPAGVGQAGIVNALSGNTTDYISGANTCLSLASAITPIVSSTRLRSFTGLGNGTFEIDQRNTNSTLVNPVTNTFLCDRWVLQRSGSLTGAMSSTAILGQPTAVPGTSYYISQGKLNIKLTAQQTSLAAGDYAIIMQQVEGPQWRELAGDATSVSILAYCDVAIGFGMSIRSYDGTRSYCGLCSVPAATWTLVQIPNISVPSGGNFSMVPGGYGYLFSICLAAGSTYTAPSNGAWNNSNFLGALGQDNFFSKPLNTNLYLAFASHEPGSQCTTPMDLSYGANLDGPFGCTRYYQKSYNMVDKPGTVTGNGALYMIGLATQSLLGIIPFSKRMAKLPAAIAYSPVTGAINNIRDVGASVDKAASVWTASETSLGGWSVTSPNSSNYFGQFHYTADTGL